MTDSGALMDGIYVRQRHIYDATRKFYLLGRDTLIADLAAAPGDAILEIGCGTGRNLVKIARRYPCSACYGLDISSTMLMTARKSVLRAGLASRIAMVEADASAFDAKALFGRDTFDKIVISYALSMIPPWRDVLQHAASLLAPDGSLYVIDFGNQAGLPPAFKVVLRAWLAKFHVTARDSLAEDITLLAARRGLTCSAQPLFRGYAIKAKLSRPPGPHMR